MAYLGDLGELALALGDDQETVVLTDLGDAELDELLGKTKRIKNSKKRKKAVTKVKKAKIKKLAGKGLKSKNGLKLKTMQETYNLTAKSLFENRINMLDDRAQMMLRTKKWQIVDKVLYSTKFIGGKTNVDMFESGDEKREGITNLLQARLNANENFLVIGIRVLTYTPKEGEEITEANWKTAGVGVDFGLPCSEVANGNFQIMNDQTSYGDENSSACFRHNRTDVEIGYHRLEIPKMLVANKGVKCNFKFAKAAPAGTMMRVELIGAITCQA